MTAPKKPVVKTATLAELGSNLGDDAGGELPSRAPVTAKVATQPVDPESVRYEIELEDNENIPPTGLHVGVNGKAWLIPAGVPVKVPASVIGVLRTAYESVPVFHPVTRRVMDYKRRMRFPYHYTNNEQRPV